jgi:hypothetical protein
VITMSARDKAYRLGEARWQLALQMTIARRTARNLAAQAKIIEGEDWRLANALRVQSRAHLDTLAVLRTVSRSLRGI